MEHKFLLSLHAIFASAIIGLILVQNGKGAQAGVSLGSTSPSNTVFGSHGSSSFLTKLIALLSILLAFTSLSVTVMHREAVSMTSLGDRLEQHVVPSIISGEKVVSNTSLPQIPAQFSSEQD